MKSYICGVEHVTPWVYRFLSVLSHLLLTVSFAGALVPFLQVRPRLELFKTVQSDSGQWTTRTVAGTKK